MIERAVAVLPDSVLTTLPAPVGAAVAIPAPIFDSLPYWLRVTFDCEIDVEYAY